MRKSPDDKKSGWDDDGSGWRRRVRRNAQPWKLGKPPRLSSMWSCEGRKRRCSSTISFFLSHIYRLLLISHPFFNFFNFLDFTSGISNGQTTVKGWARDCFHEEEEEVIWQRHHFRHDDVSKPSIHIITLFCGMMMSKELANIKFSMYINNVYSCLNTLFQHAYLIF